MPSEEIDEYLRGLEEPKRSTLEALRRSILRLVPEAEQGLSYGVPVFRLGGKAIAGFSAAKHHLSYLPHSGSVLSSIPADELSGFEVSKGALRFSIDQVLPDRLVELLIATRRREAGV